MVYQSRSSFEVVELTEKGERWWGKHWIFIIRRGASSSRASECSSIPT